ncbi:cytochrome c oxidase assembly protein [Paracoccus sp. S-4012]|uniref:cytochrome c oxidase assembly protein n=1 Tax=Paracoccus sp. S-4012 TaxID=2665648 RepID=UPI0012B064DD|nr:cytochrome c oxidase assembly protein [Paracoccus sp. S-4012]MRX52262.1 cytochrome c oxidase assembly protein [Paracoccus sp. S-4012]
MRLKAALALLPLIAGPAGAHGTDLIPPEAVWHAWSFDPLVVAPLLAALWLYGRGVSRLWGRAGQGRGIGRAQVALYLLGVVALIVALVSPLDRLGGTLLSAHMAQHGLLVSVVPPLLMLGRPGVAMAWGFPTGWSRRRSAAVIWRGLGRAGRALSVPLMATVLHGVVLWVWHAPGLFDAALARDWLHWIEHATFLGTALLFWQAMLGARAVRRPGPALAGAFVTLLHGGFLGALITLAPVPLYPWYEGHTQIWGLSHLADQQLAGLIMWVPMGAVYFGACLLNAVRLMRTAPEAPAIQLSGHPFASGQGQSNGGNR